MLDLYDFKMSLFDHEKSEQFLLLVCNFKSTFAATGTLEMEAKFQYLCTLLCGKELYQLDMLPDDVKNTITLLTVDYVLKGLA